MIWDRAAQLAAKVHATNAVRAIARAAQIAAQESAAKEPLRGLSLPAGRQAGKGACAKVLVIGL